MWVAINNSFLNIARRKTGSIIIVAVCAAAAFFLAAYMHSVAQANSQLERLPKAIGVSAEIRNLNGTQVRGLQIKEAFVEGIASSEAVERPLITAQLSADVIGATSGGEAGGDVSVFAANDVAALPMLSEAAIRMQEGVSLGFFASSEPVCVASSAFLSANGLSLGDDVELALYAHDFSDSPYMMKLVPLAECSLRVVGEAVAASSESGQPPDITCPELWVRGVFNSQSVPYFADSMQFEVKEPLRLNEFKEEMEGLGLLRVNGLSDFDVDGIALYVKDEVFIRAVSSVQRNITVLRAFLPLMVALNAALSFVVSYLTAHSRRRETALARTLGAGVAYCFCAYFIESLALSLLGGVLGVLASYALLGGEMLELYAPLVFCASYMAGAVASFIAFCRFKAMEMLTVT
jgi:hypothetical protein